MKYISRNLCRTIITIAGVVTMAGANGASVVPREAPAKTTTTVNISANSRPSGARASGTSVRVPTASTSVSNTAPAVTTSQPDVTTTPAATTDTPAEKQDIVITDRSAQFSVNSSLSDSVADGGNDTLAERIRQQRAALDAQSASQAASIATAATAGTNSCDTNLRACMQSKCGADYSKCRGDTDTLWGTKMDACRRDLACTGEEYALFSREIKADRDMNARLTSYNKILNCGNSYNDCIVSKCGVTYSECLGKKAGDAAIAACDNIARDCREQDSGLAARMMDVFGTLRQTAEKQIRADEERLYALRDQMRDVCTRMGALFDERSLDCVYTVEFYAGDDSTLFASKKTYAGASFDCTPNWFGIDITTFRENAYRLTREQTSASSAMLGSGVGMAVGSLTSGVVGRAIDRQRADSALKDATKPGTTKTAESATPSEPTTPGPATESDTETGAETESARQ